ncbi:hypothetical protein HDV02_000995 [Globomyces sp. JEL0801]|nr:hypothetical protein HDV02_000995 [Globomyces sp. JEL0801]
MATQIPDCSLFFPAIYNKLLGNGKGQLSINDCCASTQVVCKGGRIAELRLTNNGFAGEIPNEISQLTGLTILVLGSNKLTGVIPDAISQLTSLQVLDVSSNQLSGSLPSTMSQMVALRSLDLSINKYTGNFPSVISSFSKLEELYIQKNKFSGNLPASLPPRVYDIDFSVNEFSGSLPPSLTKLVDLVAIQFQDNQLSGELPKDIGALYKLTIFGIGDSLTGDIPKELGNCKKLKTLILTGTFPNGIPSEVKALPNYQSGTSTGAFKISGGSTTTTTSTESGGPPILIIVAVVVGLLLLVGGGLYFFFSKKKKQKSDEFKIRPTSQINFPSYDKRSNNQPKQLESAAVKDSFAYPSSLSADSNSKNLSGTIDPPFAAPPSQNSYSAPSTPNSPFATPGTPNTPPNNFSNISDPYNRFDTPNVNYNPNKVVKEVSLGESSNGFAQNSNSTAPMMSGVTLASPRESLTTLPSINPLSGMQSVLFDSRLIIKKQMAGSGGSGQVYKAIYAGKNAVAKIPIQEKHEHLIYEETQMLEKLQSPYIVKLLQFMSNARIPIPGQDYIPQTAVLIEFMNFGTFSQYLKHEPPTFRIAKYSLEQYNLVLSQTLALTKMVAKGMEFIHRMGYNHLDMKPENVLLHQNPDRSLVAKISDFGSTRPEGSYDPVFQTPGFIPPEGVAVKGQLILPQKTSKYDIFAFGGCLINIVTLENYATLWSGLDKSSNEIKSFLSRHLQNASLVKLILACLDNQPTSRPTASEIVAVLETLDQASFQVSRNQPMVSKFISRLPTNKNESTSEMFSMLSGNSSSIYKHTPGKYLFQELQLKSPCKWSDFIQAFETEFDVDADFDREKFKGLVKPVANRVTSKILDTHLFATMQSLENGEDEEEWTDYWFETMHDIILDCSITKLE